MEENNKLIAEFMGYEVQKDPTERFFGRYKTPLTKVWVKEIDLQFDTSWDWLMPVIIKAKEILIRIYDFESGREIKLTNTLSSLDINKVYQAVIEFIIWFNRDQNEY